jgi:EAL domain-containing protein (putative c-di-GMP-specific phosphodiesterase class I)
MDTSLPWTAWSDLLRSLVPEIASTAVFDAEGEPLWFSGDFLAPEDHVLAATVLRNARVADAADARYDVRADGPLFAGLEARHEDGTLAGVVLLSLELAPGEAIGPDPLERRLRAALTCLAHAITPARAADVASQAEVTASTFELHVQPIRSLEEGLDLLRFEVLLRLRDADGSLHAPAEFLPVAEESGQLAQIDRWVVASLVEWLADNRRSWTRVPSVFAVNLTGQTARDSGFADYVRETLVASRIPPEALCFEFPSAAVRDTPELVAASASALHHLGCQVAIDDVGSPSLPAATIRAMPAQYVKIDHALIVGAGSDAGQEAEVAELVRLADGCGLRTVAEGVETDDTLLTARRLGVHLAQGFRLGMPEPITSYDFVAASRRAS